MTRELRPDGKGIGVGTGGHGRKHAELMAASDPSVAYAQFKTFYMEHYRTGIALCLLRGLSPEDAEDVSSGAMCGLWLSWARVENPIAYYRRVVHNMGSIVIRDKIRARELVAKLVRQNPDFVNALKVGGEVPDTSDLIPDQAERRESVERALHALRETPEPQQVSVLLDAAGLSSRERAAYKGVTEGTERTHLSRGLSRVRQLMNEEGEQK